MRRKEGSSNTKFLVFGNPMLRQDSMPLRLITDLRKRFPDAEFREFDPAENMEAEGRDLNIIDTVEGIDKVRVITDIESIRTSRLYSMHDFDLSHSLKLLKKMGYLDSVKVFGIPMRISRHDALDQLSKAIASSLS